MEPTNSLIDSHMNSSHARPRIHKKIADFMNRVLGRTLAGIAFILSVLAGWIPDAGAVDFSFEVYEMPRTTMDALQKHLDSGAEKATAAYSMLSRMSGVSKEAELKVTARSGERVKADSGGAPVGNAPSMGVEGLNLEIDSIVTEFGEVEMNASVQFLSLASGKISQYSFVTAVIFPPNHPVPLQVWNEGAKARALFVTATDAGKFQPELSDRAMLRLDLEVVELNNSGRAKLLAEQGDIAAIEAARREGETRLYHSVHTRSGQRMQTRAGSGTSRQFPAGMTEYQVDVAPAWGADRTEANVRVDLIARREGVESLTGGGDVTLSTSAQPKILLVAAANGDATPLAVLIRTSLCRIGSANPKLEESVTMVAPPEGGANDPTALHTKTYPVPAGFMPSLVKQYFGDGLQRAAKEVLSAAGIAFPPGAAALFDGEKGVLLLRHNAAAHETVRKMIEP
jgi:hypothetical protein